jgi:hypothetical protein
LIGQEDKRGRLTGSGVILHGDAHDIVAPEVERNIRGTVAGCGGQGCCPVYRETVIRAADHDLRIRVGIALEKHVARATRWGFRDESDLDGWIAGEVDRRVVGRAVVRSGIKAGHLEMSCLVSNPSAWCRLRRKIPWRAITRPSRPKRLHHITL